MLLMLLIGWTILLPAVVVTGLYIGSSVLRRRRAAPLDWEEVLVAERWSEAPRDVQLFEVTPEAITGRVSETTAPDRAPLHSTV